MKWFTSDIHFGHANVIRYCDRPYRTADNQPDVGRMNRDIIDRWNALITREDEVFFLGDLYMNPSNITLLNRLNFGHLTWVFGNHDRPSKALKWLEVSPLKSKITTCTTSVVTLGGIEFEMVHRPIDTTDTKPTLVGHVHEKWQTLEIGTVVSEYRQENKKLTLSFPMLNVGVDVHGMNPINELRVLELMLPLL